MQPVTVTSTVASDVCHIHIHHKLVFMNDAAMRKPNQNKLYTDNIFMTITWEFDIQRTVHRDILL